MEFEVEVPLYIPVVHIFIRAFLQLFVLGWIEIYKFFSSFVPLLIMFENCHTPSRNT